MKHLTLAVATTLGVATVIAACKSTPVPAPSPASLPSNASTPAKAAPSAGTTANTAVKPGAVQHRVVRVVADPTAGKSQKVASYWDYGRDAPFKVANYTATASTKPGPKNAAVTSIVAQVQLPNLTAHKLHLLQVMADANASGSADANASGAADGTSSDDGVTAGADFPTTDDAVAVDGSDDGSTTDVAATADAGATSSEEAAADTVDDVDPNAMAADEAGVDPSFPSVSEASAELTGPHEVDLEVDNLPFMSNDDDTVTLTDKTTGQTLDVSYDQEWRNFTVNSDDGKLEFQFNPGGTYTVNGQVATDVRSAVGLMAKSPVVTGASPYALAMLVARVGRLAPEAGRDGGGGGTHITSVSVDAQSRAFVLGDALLKTVLKTSAATNPPAPAH